MPRPRRAGRLGGPDRLVTQAPFATPPVLAGTADIATLAAKVKPAVVNITTVHEMQRRKLEMPDGLSVRVLRSARGPAPTAAGGGGGDEVMKQQALGSGFLIDGKVTSSRTRTSSTAPTR